MRRSRSLPYKILDFFLLAPSLALCVFPISVRFICQHGELKRQPCPLLFFLFHNLLHLLITFQSAIEETLERIQKQPGVEA